MRKFGSALLIFTLAAFAPISVAHSAKADDPTPSTTMVPAEPLAAQSGEQSNKSDDQGRPRHHIDEDREGGFEGIQLIVVGAAIVVALGLAYRAGRRRRDA